MLGLDYNTRVSNETQTFPLSYFYADNMHPAYRAPLHWHSQPEIVHVISGSLKLYLNGEKHVLQPNDIVYITPNTVHGFAPQQCVYEIINFNIQEIILRNSLCKSMLKNFTDNSMLIHPFIHAHEDTSDIHNSAINLFSVVSSNADNSELIKLGSLFEFLGIILKMHHYTENYSDSNYAHLFKPVFDFIEQSYTDPITLPDLVGHSKLSTSRFIELFRTLFRQTPMDYLNSYRIEQACTLLINSELSVTEISHRSGFNDSAYFTKVFKRYKNTTPKKYRMQYQNVSSL